MVVRGARRADAFISEVMDVLNEWFYTLVNDTLPFGVTDSCEFVTGECFLKNSNEWTVSGKVDSPRFA